MNAFLTRHGWADAKATPMAQDASARRYTRLQTADGARAIVMHDPEGDVALFARLARHLCGLGLSAPAVLAEDPGAGFLLLEDLGDGLIARLATDPKTEQALYRVATDALIALHRHPPAADLPVATPEHLATMVDLAFTEYAGMPNPPAPILTLFHEILAEHALPADVMILRDYHAENILWLPERHGAAQAGLLDFQDALQGHRAYDLVSLLEDARRDVTPATREAMLHHYIHATGQSDAAFRASFAVLGAQRNLRILGVFARLARVRHKPHYIDLIPRVWAHLQTDLAHPALAKLRPLVTNALPAPNAAHLHWLKSTCPTP